MRQLILFVYLSNGLKLLFCMNKEGSMTKQPQSISEAKTGKSGMCTTGPGSSIEFRFGEREITGSILGRNIKSLKKRYKAVPL